MNTTHTQVQEGNDAFLNLVDFKWLMAGVGWWVSLSRLQRDRAYADECLQLALKSDSQLLREHGFELLDLRLRLDAHCDAAIPAGRLVSRMAEACH
jgi:hypothetical protein